VYKCQGLVPVLVLGLGLLAAVWSFVSLSELVRLLSGVQIVEDFQL
jgi:hypothetical protein